MKDTLLRAYAGRQDMPGGSKSAFVALVFSGTQIERVKLSGLNEDEAAWLVARAIQRIKGPSFTLTHEEADVGKKAIQLLLEQSAQ